MNATGSKPLIALIKHNALLACLQTRLCQRALQAGVVVELVVGQVLYEPGQTQDRIILPLAGLVSAVVITEDGREVQTATVGREGAIGLSADGFVDRAFSRAVVQLPGRALFIAAAELAALTNADPTFHNAVARYREILVRTLMQSVTCNAVHSTQRRCARWILTAYDHAGGQKIPVTQTFLAEMLGVKRNAVSRVVREFQTLELIRTRWGTVEVLNADFLGDMACECYHIIRREIGELSKTNQLQSRCTGLRFG